MSADAFAAYRNLVYETPGFVSFFRTVTPISEIADLHVGSRPASRTKSDRIEDLRAIPWVFSWSLARIMLPGWYGFGTAVEQLVQRRGDVGHGTAQRDVPRVAVLSDAAVQHGHGAGEDRFPHRVPLRGTGGGHGAARAHLRPHRGGDAADGRGGLLAISGRSELLEGNPALARSFRDRRPYIDPLNHLQVEALRRFRAGETDEQIKRAILLEHQRDRGRVAQQRLNPKMKITKTRLTL